MPTEDEEMLIRSDHARQPQLHVSATRSLVECLYDRFRETGLEGLSIICSIGSPPRVSRNEQLYLDPGIFNVGRLPQIPGAVNDVTFQRIIFVCVHLNHLSTNFFVTLAIG